MGFELDMFGSNKKSNRLEWDRKENLFSHRAFFQEVIALPLHIIPTAALAEKPLPVELQQKEILLPRFLAEGGSDVYCLFSPTLRNWQLVVINRHLVAREGMQVLFFNHLTEEYTILPFEELPLYLEKTDPTFRLRQADLEDMYIGVVIAVCQRIEPASRP